MRLWGINPTNSVVITQSLVLRFIVLRCISKLICWKVNLGRRINPTWSVHKGKS